MKPHIGVLSLELALAGVYSRAQHKDGCTSPKIQNSPKKYQTGFSLKGLCRQILTNIQYKSFVVQPRFAG